MKNKLVVAFDCDDVILIPSVVTGTVDTPNYDTIAVYRWFQAQGNFMIVWSGGGIDYATMWARKLGLNPDEIREKTKDDSIDISFDDCMVDLAKVNIRVKRIDNQISRKEWNEHKLPPLFIHLPSKE